MFNLSGVSGPELAACINECQVVLIPLLPDASAIRNAEAAQALLSTLPNVSARVGYIINRMEEFSVAKSAYEKLNRHLDKQLFKKTISQQQNIQESLAEGIVLPFFAPDAQAVEVWSEIVQWLELPIHAANSRTQQRWSER